MIEFEKIKVICLKSKKGITFYKIKSLAYKESRNQSFLKKN